MKRHGLILTVLAVTAMIAGCSDEVTRLKSQNRVLADRLDEKNAQLDQLKAQRDEMSAKLEEVMGKSNLSATELMSLQEKNQEYIKAYEDLKKRYDELYDKRRPIVIGAVLPPELNTALKAFAQANPKMAEFDEKKGMVKFKSDLTFAKGSAVVGDEANTMLTELAKILGTQGAQDFAVYIAGHTDDIPIGNPETKRRHPTNWYLSAHRAIGVQKALQQAGMNPDRIAVMGFGEYQPIEANQPNHKGNPANRRVEIWVDPKGTFLVDTMEGAAPTPGKPAEPVVEGEVEEVEETTTTPMGSGIVN